MRTILYLSYLGGLGGGESSLLSHLLALDRTQFSPRVICGADGGFVEELRAHEIPIEVIPFALPYFKRGFLPTASLDFFPRLYSYLKAQRIDLIHCNDPEAAYYAAPLAKLRRVPLVWTSWAWWHAERGWKSAFYETMMARIITPTHYIKACLVQANPRLENKVTALPFGVDTQAFAPAPRDPLLLNEFGIARDAPILTILARFQSVKGHANFLDAAPHILDMFPTTRFLFVGDTVFDTRDANATRDAIRDRVAADERLRAAVVFGGFRRDIPRVLHLTDVLVCPSDFETYGMSNLEAKASGVPVVSTNVGGPSETIVDGETGFLVPPRDPEMLTARVIQLLAQPTLRAAMGMRGRERVEKHFALNASVKQMARVYQDVLR